MEVPPEDNTHQKCPPVENAPRPSRGAPICLTHRKMVLFGTIPHCPKRVKTGLILFDNYKYYPNGVGGGLYGVEGTLPNNKLTFIPFKTSVIAPFLHIIFTLK